MQLFYGEFAYEAGDYNDSKQTFENILNSTILDTANEKLYTARLFESLARSYFHDDNKEQADEMQVNFFKEYPQLFPFSGFTIKMNLTSNAKSDMEKNIIKQLKDCDIDFTDENEPNVPKALVTFFTLKNKFGVSYIVTKNNGEVVIPEQKMYFKKEESVGKELALRLFGISGPVEFDSD